MLLENATLLLAASDILTDASWDSLTVPTAVLCSFLLGESVCVCECMIERQISIRKVSNYEK